MIRNKLIWKNNQNQYGLISKSLHWLSAIAVFGLFGLGYWMVDLDYYSQWYQQAPHWHESIGILLLFATGFRLAWRYIEGSPDTIASHSNIEKKAAKVAIFFLYIALVVVLLSGYLITSADGKAIAIFDWFTFTALQLPIDNQEDVAGTVHYYLAYGVLILALLHAFAALKHHFIDKDTTLMRMIK